jgi:H+-transporting ATPase
MSGLEGNHAGLSTAEAAELLQRHGRNELQDKKTPKWKILLQLLIQPMPCMIWVAALTEAAISNWADLGILLAIQLVNASISFYETTKVCTSVLLRRPELHRKCTKFFYLILIHN